MATYFVSSADGDNGDSGLTLDLAWATKEFAAESGALNAGDIVFIRPNHSEIPTTDILLAYSGAVGNHIIFARPPRSVHAITSSDWTNGSSTVTIDDNDMSRSEHQGRWITAPDGCKYLITRVSATDTIILDREYAGATSLNDATASIDADNWPDVEALWDAYDDSGDTIKKADWIADDTLPVIDFNDGNFEYYINGYNYISFYGIEFKDSADAYGLMRLNSALHIYFKGCLFKQSANNSQIVATTESCTKFNQCIIEGSGAGTSQRGLIIGGNGMVMNGAIYNCGDYGARLDGGCLCNVNIGVEQANGDNDLDIYGKEDHPVKGYDIKLGGTNGLVAFTNSGFLTRVQVENYQKILGANRVYFPGGYYERVAVSGETPNKKNSDYVIKITPNINNVPNKEFAYRIPILVSSLAAGTYTFTFDIYNDSGVTINDGDATDDIFLTCEYIENYEDTTEYVSAKVESVEHTIADAADADDWDSLSVTFTTATTANIIIDAYIKFYSAAGTLFIDTKPAVT